MKPDQPDILDLAAAHSAACRAAHVGAASRTEVGTGNFKKKVVSDSMGVHRTQIGELRAFDKAHGCEVEITPDGSPVFDNSQQMRKYAKAHGWRHYGY